MVIYIYTYICACICIKIYVCRKYSSENQGNSLAQKSTSGSVSIASFVVSMDNTALGLVEKWKIFHVMEDSSIRMEAM